VAKKRDIRGKHFGFVRFLEVVVQEELGFRLEDVWIGESKLKVNLARFGRERVSSKVENRMKEVIAVSGGGGDGPMVVTYHDVVANVRIQKKVVVTASMKVVLFPSESRLRELERCFVAELAFHKDVGQIKNSLALGGFAKIAVMSMGSNLVLLACPYPSVIDEA